MRYFKFLAFALALFLGQADILRAQAQNRFTNYSSEHGLAAVTVNCVFKDSRGFLWIGTQNGLNRYDGRNFKTFRNDPALASSVIGDDIRAVLEDAQGRIWIGTKNGGICYYNYLDAKFHSPALTGNQKRALLNITAMQLVGKDMLVLGTKDDGLFFINLNDLQVAGYSERPAEGHSPLTVNDICTGMEPGSFYYTLEKGGLYKVQTAGKKTVSAAAVQVPFAGLVATATDGSAFALMPKKFARIGENPVNLPFSTKFAFTAFAFDKNGDIWAGTSGDGVYHFTSDGKFLRHYFFNPQDRTGLIDSWVNDIFCDTDGNVFIATNAGLSINNVADNIIQISSPASGRIKISSTQINAVCTSKDDNIWIGYMDSGIDRLTPDGKLRDQFRSTAKGPLAIPSDIIFSLYQDSRGILWAGTHRGIMKFNPATNTFFSASNSGDFVIAALKDKMILDMTEDNTKHLWVSTYQEGVFVFDFGAGSVSNLKNNAQDPRSLSGNTIHTLCRAQDGKIWAGSNVSGISVIDPLTLKCVQIKHDPNNPSSIPNDEIFCIERDARGKIWIGTTKGISRFEPEANRFINFSTANGLASPVVFGICFDDSIPYISTFRGIYAFNYAVNRFTVVGSLPEVANTEYNQGAYYADCSGMLYFGNAILGLVTFNPDRLRKELSTFPLYLVAVKKLYKDFDSGADPSTQSHLDFTYKDYVLTFQFSALDLKNGAGLEYAFLLEGLDENWVSTGKEASRTFTNLNPGDYKLRAKVSRDGFNWFEAAMPLSIYIEPPFHQTWWFKTLGILLFICLVTGAYIFRINLLKRKQAAELEKQRLTAELNTARRVQQNLLNISLPESPHFEISARCDTALEVGGDFYDVFWHDEAGGKLAIANIDISGKGMNASIGSFIIAGMLSNMRTVGFESTAAAATTINSSFFQKKPEKRLFAAFCLAIIDFPNKKIDLTNCGQPEIILLRGGEVSFFQTSEPRMPIGLRKKVQYQNAVFDLQSGDMLFFYSDAFPESLSTEGVAYGYKNIEKVIKANYQKPITELSNALYTSLEAYWKGAGVYDDASMIILKIN